MELYLVLNAMLSIFAMAGMKVQMLPVRLKVILGSIAIIMWFLPVHYLSWLRTDNSFVPIISDIVPTLFMNLLHFPFIFGHSPIEVILTSLLGIGVVKFVVDHLRFTNDCNKFMASKTREYNQSIEGMEYTIVETPLVRGAMVSGILKPVIWLGNLNDHPHLVHTALLHESMHVRRSDPLKLLILHFLTCLMWWNPLVIKLSRQVRDNIEMGCDLDCKNRMDKDEYRDLLAELMLLMNASRESPFSAKVATGSTSTNISRIKTLSQKSIIRGGDVFHYVLASLIFVSLWILVVVSGQTGLDGKRFNQFELHGDQSFSLTLQQMPVKSLGIVMTQQNISSVYVHKEVAQRLLYIKGDFESWQALADYLSQVHKLHVFQSGSAWFIQSELLSENDLKHANSNYLFFEKGRQVPN